MDFQRWLVDNISIHITVYRKTKSMKYLKIEVKMVSNNWTEMLLLIIPGPSKRHRNALTQPFSKTKLKLKVKINSCRNLTSFC